MVLTDGRDREKIEATFGLDRQAHTAGRDRCSLAWKGAGRHANSGMWEEMVTRHLIVISCS